LQPGKEKKAEAKRVSKKSSVTTPGQLLLNEKSPERTKAVKVKGEKKNDMVTPGGKNFSCSIETILTNCGELPLYLLRQKGNNRELGEVGKGEGHQKTRESLKKEEYTNCDESKGRKGNSIIGGRNK